MDPETHGRGESGGAAPRIGAAASALLRIDAAALVLFWLASALSWSRLPERIPIHFDPTGTPDGWVEHNAGGLFVWMLLPLLATVTSLILRWASRFAMRNPTAWSIPQKQQFLALSDDERQPVVATLRLFMARMILLTTLLLVSAHAAAWASATEQAGLARGLFGIVLLLLVVVFILGLLMARTTSRTIRDLTRSGFGLLMLAATMLACSTGSPGREDSQQGAAVAEEAMPVRGYPGGGAAVDPDSSLRAELLAMGLEDQAVRQGVSPERMQDTAFLRRMMRTDTALSVRLREIVGEHGWPDADRVGAEAVRAAFLIVQHSPFDDFREEMLPHVERDAHAGVLNPQNYAAMVDRIRLHRGQPQLYGTQYSFEDGVLVRDPVEDPDGLEARRAELGLMPIAEYERLLSEAYGAEVRTP